MGGISLYDKIWNDHVVASLDDGSDLIYVDRHLIHEVSTPQAFESMFKRGRAVRRRSAYLGVADHAVPSSIPEGQLAPGLQRELIELFQANCRRAGLPFLTHSHRHHGIVHVIGPETGFTLPGLTVVCGDSHTSTHGAFGALAFGIGTSECEMVLSTQCLRQKRARPVCIEVTGTLPDHVTAKDLALALIARLGAGGARGCAVHFTGEAIRAMSMDARMTLCNMSIEMGARVGLIEPDEQTQSYLQDRPLAPRGALWAQACTDWALLRNDADATFDWTMELDARDVTPHVTWGTNPAQAIPVTGRIPDPESQADPQQAEITRRALSYMGLQAGAPVAGTPIDRVFIGSCTNSRLSDLQDAARIVAGRKISPRVTGLIVPGSHLVRQRAEAEGLDKIFRDAGFSWGSPGCSMCVAMNGDVVAPHERCASTSNRNFEGRQGVQARTHLMSPAMAAAAALEGAIVNISGRARA